MKLDAIDRRILSELQRDGRMTNQALAERVGLSPTPCLRRVRRLEEDGVIGGYVAVVDQRAVDLPVSVFISIKLERQREEDLDRFAEAVSRWPEVMECYLMTGSEDFMLRVVVEDLLRYQDLVMNVLTQIPGVANIRSSFALDQVKYTTALPTGHLRKG